MGRKNHRKNMKPTFAGNLHAMVHESRLSVDALAEAIATTRWNLYKMVEPDEPDRNLPAVRLLPLMKLTNDHRPLHFLAGALDYELVPLGASKRKTAKDLGPLAEAYGNAVQVLTDMYDQGHIDQDGVNTVRELLKEVVGHKREADKVLNKQIELNL